MIHNELEMLKRENDGAESSIDTGVQQKIRDMVKYAWSKGLGLYETEILRKDLIGMAQEASLRGEGFAEVLGTDERSFCDSIVESGRKSGTERGVYVLYRLSVMALIYAAAQFLLYGMWVPVTLAYFATLPFFLLGCLVELYLPQLHFAGSRGQWISMLIEIAALAVLVGVFGRLRPLQALFTVQWAVFLLAHLAVFVLLRLIWNRYMKKAAT